MPTSQRSTLILARVDWGFSLHTQRVFPLLHLAVKCREYPCFYNFHLRATTTTDQLWPLFQPPQCSKWIYLKNEMQQPYQAFTVWVQVTNKGVRALYVSVRPCYIHRMVCVRGKGYAKKAPFRHPWRSHAHCAEGAQSRAGLL